MQSSAAFLGIKQTGRLNRPGISGRAEEAGHAFRFEVGHLFRFHFGHRSDLGSEPRWFYLKQACVDRLLITSVNVV